MPLPTNLDEIVVFAANEDPNAPNNGRLYQHYDVWVSHDNMATFELLAESVRTASLGLTNLDDDRATYTRVYDGLGNVLVEDITNIRFVFYCVSNTQGVFYDPYQGLFNEDAGYQATCAGTEEPEDVDGYRTAIEASIIKEIDVFGFYPGDSTGDGAIDLDDLADFVDCLTGPNPGGPLNPACKYFDFAPADGDVDLDDFASFQERFTGPPAA
jgi:hypothetical protein